MNFNLHDLALLAPEDFLLGAACAILFIDLFLKPTQRAITHWLSIAALLGALILILTDHDPATTAFGGAYIHDSIAAVLKVFILGIVAVALGIAFEKQNIAFMVSLAFAIAASANFPVLFMSVLWKDCTTRGAVIGGFLGLISSVVLTLFSPSVWEATLGYPKGSAWFPYTSPALFSMAIGFGGVWLFSILDRSGQAAKERAAFPAQQVRSETGLGASKASGH